jgi:hypothetical protein
MLRRTSKRVKEVVLRQLTGMSAGAASPHSNCAAVQSQDHMQSGLQEECWRSAERWCTLISDSQGDHNIGTDGTESLAGVLGQCAALTHLNLGYNEIAAVGTREREASRFVAWSSLWPPFGGGVGTQSYSEGGGGGACTACSLPSVLQTGNKKERHIVHIQCGSLRACTFALS